MWTTGNRLLLAVVGFLLVFLAFGCGKQGAPDIEKPALPPAAPAAGPLEDAKATLQKGTSWLAAQQGEDGSFAKVDEIGVTALAVAALARSPQANQPAVRTAIERGVKLLLGHQREDGAFTMKEGPALDNYRTALTILALSAVDRQTHAEQIQRARDFLLTLQSGPDSGADPDRDKDFYGGFNYQAEKGRADLSNTQLALDALKAAGLPPDNPVWERAVVFLNRCQNRSESNDSGRSGNDGGGIYAPIETKVKDGAITLPDGTMVYRSYGSMTYALLKCFLYAGLTADDPRVQAAYEWIRKNYTVDENPNLGQEGLYYYYSTMATTLGVYGKPTLTTPDGQEHNWAADLVKKLAELQSEDGSWVNLTDRWMESIPVLATSYSVLALDDCLEALKGSAGPGAEPAEGL